MAPPRGAQARGSRSSGWSSTRSRQQAIERAVDNPRELDRRLVDAQETRRILDRLYGYEVARVLWKKVCRGLSAGRVQSVATRIVVERERERMRFRAAALLGPRRPTFAARRPQPFPRHARRGRRPPRRHRPDFDEQGQLARATSLVLDEAGAARPRRTASRSRRSTVARSREALPPPPEAAVHDLDPPAGGRPQAALQRRRGRCRWRSASTRTATSPTCGPTSTTLSDDGARPPPGRRSASCTAPSTCPTRPASTPEGQERPGGARGDPPRRRVVPHPERGRPRGRARRGRALRADLAAHGRLADGRRRRQRRSACASAHATDDGRRTRVSSAAGARITFPGFLRAYVEGADDPEAELDDRETVLPALAEGDGVDARELEPKGHETQPPARYTEAAWSSALEELGVGRPVDLRLDHAARSRTAATSGRRAPRSSRPSPPSPWSTCSSSTSPTSSTTRSPPAWRTTSTRSPAARPSACRGCSDFYFGERQQARAQGAGATTPRRDRRPPRSTRSRSVPTPTAPTSSSRVGRYGPYLQRGEERASVPEDIAPDELTVEKAIELLDAAAAATSAIGTDPETGLAGLVQGRPLRAVRAARRAAETASKEKPKTASLFKR